MTFFSGSSQDLSFFFNTNRSFATFFEKPILYQKNISFQWFIYEEIEFYYLMSVLAPRGDGMKQRQLPNSGLLQRISWQ